MAAAAQSSPPWARTMDDLRAPAATWGHELKAYEREKRRVVDEGLMRGQQLRLPKGIVQQQERVFDPLLQRFRDSGVESQQRHMEERERIAHLNRAQDIDIIRGQPFNIINQTSKLEALAPGQDPLRLGGQPGHGTMGETRRTRCGKTDHPASYTDYNIVSNLPHDIHHWQKPGERPIPHEREPQGRKVPHFSVKDFDIVTNRYLSDHDGKMANEKHLRLLEATHKYSKHNKFDPLSQQFNDPRHEERTKAALDAREVEMNARCEAQLPPSFKGRLSAHYDVVSHEARNPEMLQLWDTLEDERKDRHRNRYIVEHNFHVQDVKNDHITGARRLNRIAPARFEEERRRGFNIIDNRTHGRLAKERQLHEDFTTKRLTPWERTQQGRLEEATPEMVQTIRAPAAESARGGRGLASSSSAPHLRRATPAASSVGRSRSSGALGRGGGGGAHGGSGGAAAAARTFAPSQPMSGGPPPAPLIPGSAVGAVYAQAKG